MNDPFVGMTLSIRELRKLLDELGQEPRILELRRDVDRFVLDIERDGRHQAITADMLDGFPSFLIPNPMRSGVVNRVWFTGPGSSPVDSTIRWMTGPSLLGKGVL